MTRILVPALLATALAACAVGPDYKPKPQHAPEQWQGQQPAADLAQLQKWWGGFRDPELDKLVDQAIAGNLDVKIAEQRVLDAHAQRDIAAAGGYPSLSVGSTDARARVPKGLLPVPGGAKMVNFFEGGFSASWEIDLFGKNTRQVEAADASVEASIDDRRAVLVSLLGELGQDYAGLRAAQLRYDIAKRNVTAETELVDLTRAKWKSGLGSELDVAQAEAQLASLNAVMPQLESTAAQNRHAIATLLGREPADLEGELSMPGALPPAPPSLPVALPSEVVKNRPDIRAAERRLASANAGIGVAEAERYPSFTLSPTLALASGNLKNLFQATSLLWAVEGSIKQPIFEGGKLEANIRSAQAKTEEARLSYRKTVLSAFQEVEDALVIYETEQRRHQQLAMARDADRRALDWATSRYKNGLGDFLNVLDAERNLYAAEDSLAVSEQTLTLATVALYKALGEGWQVAE